MKPLLLAAFAMAALPLVAGETQTEAPDSPLVAAAKASAAKNAKKRKATITITNDTLVKSGGHITTTASQAPLPPAPPHPSEEQLRAAEARRAAEAKAAAARDAAAKKADEEHAAAIRGKLDEAGASLYDDPSMAEHLAEEAAKPKDKKPPM
jgi:colicin import membrane protein